jgi:hypothetical protein
MKTVKTSRTQDQKYYAIKSKDHGPELARIERAATAFEALILAFGKPGMTDADIWEAKFLGTSIKAFDSKRKKLTLLSDPKGWYEVEFPNRKTVIVG